MSKTHTAQNDQRNEAVFIYVNGELLPRSMAKVSVFDSGFLLGDGIWEGIRLNKEKWIFFEDHMSRLFEAARSIDLEIGASVNEIFEALERTRKINNMTTDVYARIMFTRGEKTKAFQHPDFSIFGSTFVIIMEFSLPILGPNQEGLKLITVPQVRGSPMSQDPKLNSHSKLNCVLACIQAKKSGGDEALMLDPLGFVSTSNSCNFFIVRKGELWTSTGDYCMNGITREKVIEIAVKLGIPTYQKNFSLVDVYGAAEIFLTGTFGGQTLVTEVDGRKIGKGQFGPITLKIKKSYESLIASY